MRMRIDELLSDLVELPSNERKRPDHHSVKAISLRIVKPLHFTNQLALLLRVVGLV
jgi:hypothetical protein